jgi:hypothetical protein
MEATIGVVFLGLDRERDEQEIVVLTLAYIWGRTPLHLRPKYAGKL